MPRASLPLKRFYLDTYDDIRDNADAWAQKVNDEYTYAEYVDMKIRETVNVYVISAELYDSYGYSISDEGWELINDEYQSALEYFGGEEKLAQALEEDFGMTTDDLRKVYEIQYKYERVLYDSGIVQVNDADREKYYEEKYICAKIIFIGTKVGYKQDDEGNYIINGSGYETYELTDEQKAEKISVADGVQAKIEGGELSCDDVYTDEDVNEFDASNYPDGIFFGRDNYPQTGLISVAEAAFALEVGGVARVSDENGEFIICRCELPDKAYEGTSYAQFSDMDELCAKNKFDQRMQELMSGVEADSDIIDKYSVTNVSPVSY